MALIDEKKLAELKKHWDGFPFKLNGNITNSDIVEMLDTLEALWKVARAGSNIEDILEVPTRLGDHSQEVMAKAIDDFRDALAALHGNDSDGKPSEKEGLDKSVNS